MALGTHCFLSLYDCDRRVLDDIDTLISISETCAEVSGATVVQTIYKKFEPQGATVLTLLEESHISIHTWPERGEAAVDIFTCGDCDPSLGAKHIIDSVHSQRYKMEVVER
jgi:S-adenosylmethionine decarboxylase